MKKGVIAFALVLSLVCAGLAGAYYVVGSKTESTIRTLIEARPMIELASYEKGLSGSSFQIYYPTLGIRLDGTVEHGPLLLRGLTPAMDRIQIRLHPEADEDSPFAEVLSTVPELADAVLEMTLGFDGAMRLEGLAPVIDRTIEIEGQPLKLAYSGGKIGGSGHRQLHVLENLTVSGELGLLTLQGEELDFSVGPMQFDEQIEGLENQIPRRMVATLTAEAMRLKAVGEEDPVDLQATALRFREEAGMTPENTLHGQGAMTIETLVVNGEKIDQLSYVARIKGLQAEPARAIQKMVAQFQSQVQQGAPNASMGEMIPKVMHQVHAMLAGDSEIGFEIKGTSATFGENQFRLDANLAAGGTDYLQRLQGTLQLDVAQPLAEVLATLYMANQAQANPQAQFPPPDQFLAGLIEQQWIAYNPDTAKYHLGINLDGAQDRMTMDAGMELPPPSSLAPMVLGNAMQ